MSCCFESKGSTDLGRPGMFWDHARIVASLWLRVVAGTVLRVKRLGAFMV